MSCCFQLGCPSIADEFTDDLHFVRASSYTGCWFYKALANEELMQILRNARHNEEAKITRLFLKWVSKHGPDDDYVGYKYKGVDMKRMMFSYFRRTKMTMERDAVRDERMMNFFRQICLATRIVAKSRILTKTEINACADYYN